MNDIHKQILVYICNILYVISILCSINLNRFLHTSYILFVHISFPL